MRVFWYLRNKICEIETDSECIENCRPERIMLFITYRKFVNVDYRAYIIRRTHSNSEYKEAHEMQWGYGGGNVIKIHRIYFACIKIEIQFMANSKYLNDFG